MIEFGNSYFYIDLKTIDRLITVADGKKDLENVKEEKVILDSEGKINLTEVFQRTSPRAKEIDTAKYDMIKMLIEYVTDYEDVSDDTLGTDRAFAQAPFGFKLTFNTLLNEGIIKFKDVE